MRAPGSWRVALLCAACPALGPAAALAQAPDWRITPSVTLSSTYTDLVELPPAAGRSGWVLGVTPGLEIYHAGARVRLDLDYRLHYLHYPGLSRLDSHQQRLRSLARLEAVEDWLFVEARADIVQFARSAASVAPTPGLALPSEGRIETGIYQVSPFIRGVLSDVARYQLRYNAATIRPDDALLPDTRVSEWTGRLRNESASAKIGWGLDLGALGIHNRALGTREDVRLRASVRYAIQPGLHVSMSQGYESTDFAGADRRSGSIGGVGLEWTPGPRTQLAAFYEDRFYGSAHTFLFRHRTPRTSWRLTSTREVAVLPAFLAAGSAGSIESALAELVSSSIREPEARTREARRELEAVGIAATAVPTSGFLVTEPRLHETVRASVALLGRSNTVTMEAAHSEQRSPDGAAPALETARDLRQIGFIANWAHRLTPLSAINLGVTWLRTQGQSATSFQTRQAEAVLQYTRRLGPRATAAIGLRHTQFDSSMAGAEFTRSALFATVSIRP